MFIVDYNNNSVLITVDILQSVSSVQVYWLGPCLSGLFTAIFYQAIFNRHQVQDATFTMDTPLHQVKDASFVEEVPLQQVVQRNSRMENTR